MVPKTGAENSLPRALTPERYFALITSAKSMRLGLAVALRLAGGISRQGSTHSRTLDSLASQSWSWGGYPLRKRPQGT